MSTPAAAPPEYDFRSALSTLERDPRFAALPYREQAKARLMVLDRFGGTLPQYAALPPEEQAVFAKMLALRPPIMETPKGTAATQQWAATLQRGAANTNTFGKPIDWGAEAASVDIGAMQAAQAMKAAAGGTFLGSAIKGVMYAAPRLAQKVVEAIAPGSDLAKVVAGVNEQTD